LLLFFAIEGNDSNYSKFQMMRTEQWRANKEYMTHIQQEINVGFGNDITGDLVPLKWLISWAENPQTEDKIENDSFLCPHKKLAFNKVFSTRLVSTEVVRSKFIFSLRFIQFLFVIG